MDEISRWRLIFFVGTLTVMGVWELLGRARAMSESSAKHWARNILFYGTGAVLVRFTSGAIAMGASFYAQIEQVGLFPWLGVNELWAWLVSIAVLDLAIYLQHILTHRVPILWRLHRIHHSDLDLDASSGIRFHPIEIILSSFYKVVWVLVLGASPIAVLSFEILLNSSALFNHGNVRIPAQVDRWLRWLVVTPSMHVIHHSVLKSEMNSNYGFALSIWDRVFKTYTPQAKGKLKIGLNEYPECLNIWQMMVLPFRKS